MLRQEQQTRDPAQLKVTGTEAAVVTVAEEDIIVEDITVEVMVVDKEEAQDLGETT